MLPITPELLSEYEALTRRAGVALLQRSRVTMTGKDRATLLHKFCTQDVLGKQTGEGGEAFICNVQGKIVAYVYFFVEDDRIVLDTSPGQAEAIVKHLDRYVITEDVQFEQTELNTLLLAGAESEALLKRVNIAARRIPWGDHAFLIDGDARGPLVDAGAVSCSTDAAEILRIESPAPLYGVDITLDNLPQEVHRDAQAIHFKKGCYLGQETVARIDALGHVNKLLVQVTFAPEANVSPGLELRHGEKVVGHVTSACFSPKFAAPLALAYVRREHAAPGTKLVDCEVV